MPAHGSGSQLLITQKREAFNKEEIPGLWHGGAFDLVVDIASTNDRFVHFRSEVTENVPK